ncbi:uncharacterized protein LOC114944506 [Nylanderia fulva]|uniref:uncharacterized protein LOC114944506 n=1 Tax=Nylanderia fulva TaxID=613905 RepID=UPI0010FB27A8|nr:uncharacterized protein LOC114944506 [Nylanderia fulva]
MKAIGRILACVLLVAVFGKNVIATSAANIKFLTGQDNTIVRFNTTQLELVPGLSWLNLEDSRGILDSAFEDEDDQDIKKFEEARTFGRIRRLQFMLMPIIYKMGVMMTMLMVLTAISVKGLFIGIILLVFKFGSFLSKIYSGWHATSHQPIHLHIHNPYVQPQVYPQLYQQWPISSPEDHHYY